MISEKMLHVGEWYDGFEWLNGKQKCVSTLRYQGNGRFDDGLESRELNHHDVPTKPQYRTFEPNIVAEAPDNG
jgi:hypothetical protein